MDIIHKTFTDKKGRTIDVGIDFIGNIVAEHNTEIIATWTFDVKGEDEKEFLTDAEMEKDYERAGIGEQMLVAAEEYFSDFFILDKFTKIGAAFFNGCSKKGIPKFNHAILRNDRH